MYSWGPSLPSSSFLLNWDSNPEPVHAGQELPLRLAPCPRPFIFCYFGVGGMALRFELRALNLLGGNYTT
jgi:hypothetical protein